MMHLCGYIYDEKSIERFLETSPMVCEAGDLASGKGHDFFLFDIEQKLTGAVRPPHHQLIGDCVSHGFTGAAEDLQFVQMANAPGLDFKWLSSEFIYGAARVQIGRGACGYGDGAIVSWAFEAAQKFGMVARGAYPSVDLTNYNASLAKKWGTPGVGAPQDLVEIAKSHLVLKAQLLQGSYLYEQARDVIFNGGAIVTGSNQLYASGRDSQGFCRPSGRGGHCTYFRGFTESGGRPGIAYQQSWGKDIPSGGPVTVTLGSGRQVTLPAGCFFIDADVFDSTHRGWGNEVWALWPSTGWLTPDDRVQFVFS